MGKVAWVQTPHSPMKITQRVRLISAPASNGMAPKSCSKAGRSAIWSASDHVGKICDDYLHVTDEQAVRVNHELGVASFKP